MINHRSYERNLSSCEIEAWKTFRPEQESNCEPVQCSTNWGMKALWVRIIPEDDEELSWMHNFDDQPCHCVFLRSLNIWSFVYSLANLSQFAQIFGFLDFFFNS